MIQRLILSSLLVAALLSGGCLSFKKGGKAKDSTVSNEVESEFRQRTIDKRMAELVAQGQTPDAARTTATDEFRARYGSMGAPQK